MRVATLASALTPQDEARAVPACPGWTVHDLVAHLVGVVEDASAGRMDGVATPAWTAAQVERGRDRPVAELLAGWQAGAPAFERALATTPLGAMAAVDALTHEHDLRGALGVPGGRDHADVAAVASLLAADRAGVGSGVRIELDGRPAAGSPGAPVLVRTSAWELFRAVMGRRSAAQVIALVSGPADPAWVERFVVFGPAAAELVE